MRRNHKKCPKDFHSHEDDESGQRIFDKVKEIQALLEILAFWNVRANNQYVVIILY